MYWKRLQGLQQDLFGPMQDWLRSQPEITLTLFGEDTSRDVARCRLEGDVTTL